MVTKPKRNREYVILAAAVLGLGAAGCERDSAGGQAPPKSSSAKSPSKPGVPAHPPGGRMGTPR